MKILKIGLAIISVIAAWKLGKAKGYSEGIEDMYKYKEDPDSLSEPDKIILEAVGDILKEEGTLKSMSVSDGITYTKNLKKKLEALEAKEEKVEV
jgi:hypothetical protein